MWARHTLSVNVSPDNSTGTTSPAIGCPSCGSRNVHCVGQLPRTDIFCDIQLAELLPRSWLYECGSCKLQFRHPVADGTVLQTLYGRANKEMWRHSFDDRSDWKLADRFLKIRRLDNARMLDVGCWDGTFLRRYRDTCAVYGVELNAEAAEQAQNNGILVVGRKFSELWSHTNSYDVVTAFDVIEHVVKPKDFLAMLTARVSTAGCIILSTGNTDSLIWRWLRHRYWYCSLAEHVSFLNEAWIRLAARDLNLEVSEIVRFSHGTPGAKQTISQIAAAAVHLASATFYRSLRTLMQRRAGTSVPQLTFAKDHMLAVLIRR